MKHEEMEKLIFQLRKETENEFKEYALEYYSDSFSNWLNKKWENLCERYEIDYSVYSEYDLTKTKSFEESIVDIKNFIEAEDNFFLSKKELQNKVEDLEEFFEENGEDEIQTFKDDYKESYFENLVSQVIDQNHTWDGWECYFEEAVKEILFKVLLSKNNKL